MNRVARALRRALLPWLLGAGAVAGVTVGAVSSAVAAVPVDRLNLLVPDAAALEGWRVKVWLDAAADEGIKLDIITDSQLLAMGERAAQNIAGLVVPDSAHLRASAELVAAIKKYAYTGGKLMLVYDAGVLNDAGFYPVAGNSRFADMVGVDYAFWNNGAGAATMVGFGPVVGTKARLTALQMPPGKYLPYSAPATLASSMPATAFVPTSAADPSGEQAMAETLKKRHGRIDEGSRNVMARRAYVLRNLLGLSTGGAEGLQGLRYGLRVSNASRARDQHVYDVLSRWGGEVSATLDADNTRYTERAAGSVAADDSTLHAVSGYGYGPLGYYSYVTTGNFPGKVYLSSPEHGLVAGSRSYGSGELLFVNMPLGYFKAIGTDGALLHGFLNHFAREQVGVVAMSAQPRGRGGLIYNWHIDDGDDLRVNTKDLLDKTSMFKRGPFSLHLTTGPDVIDFGDGNGQNLNQDVNSQTQLRRLANIGVPYWDKVADHEIGSHGGWIHDYWGRTANEENVPDLTHLLRQNFEAIERVTGRKIREYSSPMGNTPTWAVRWMEARGVRGMYLVSDLGIGMHRPWRAGQRLTDKLWAFPVTPLGRYATFEEFDTYGVSDAESGQWLLDLQSFVVNQRTNRMFYNHPPGAVGHLQPLNALLTRADKLQAAGRFQWYTMAGLAEFAQRRVETDWSTSQWYGLTSFNASNPEGLANQTWLLPRKGYTLPVVVSGRGSVSWDAKHWIVIAEGGTSLKFVSYGY